MQHRNSELPNRAQTDIQLIKSKLNGKYIDVCIRFAWAFCLSLINSEN